MAEPSVQQSPSFHAKSEPSELSGGAVLLERFRAVRERTRYLTRALTPEDQVVQSMPDASPTKWHLAHTSWFFETFVLAPHFQGHVLHDEAYPYLFNSYYVQAGERHCRAQRGYISRPTVGEIWEYRRAVDEAMDTLLSGDLPRPVRDLVELGLHHEQQHQELILTDLKHLFSVNPLRPVYLELAESGEATDLLGESVRKEGEGGVSRRPAPETPALGWVSHSGGVHRIGWEGPGFAYDSEGPAHRRFLEPFAIADRLVTNGEFLHFMVDGGYQRAELWMSEGWARREAEAWSEPFYWERRDGEWWCFTLRGMRPVDPYEPIAHVNWYEADAYARWAGARLPREEEWEVASLQVPVDGNFVDQGRFHPRTVAESGKGEHDGAPRQMFGDVWEWTSSPYSPYPGFCPAEGAVGEYNGKFMVNQFVLRGGSCATSRSHIRRTYRNFFHPDASWQFTGFRLARDAG